MSIEFKTEADKISYALGMNIGESLVQLPVELNPDILAQAIKDLLAGNQPDGQCRWRMLPQCRRAGLKPSANVVTPAKQN